MTPWSKPGLRPSLQLPPVPDIDALMANDQQSIALLIESDQAAFQSQREDFVSGVDIPQLQSTVTADGGDALPIGVKSNVVDADIVPVKTSAEVFRSRHPRL